MSRSLALYRIVQARGFLELRCFSSATLKTDPSRFVHSVTKEKLENNPELMEYFKANFPEAFEEVEKETPLADHGDEEIEEPSYFTKVEEPHYPLNIRPLTCYVRDPEKEEGTRRCNKLRWEGMIPGILNGGDPRLDIYSHQPESTKLIKTNWHLLERELDRYHRNFESRVYDLTILEGPDDKEGTVHRVNPQNVQRHPVQSTIYCANFCRYHPGRPIKIPVGYVNEEESPALKRDGFIVPIHRKIECFVDDGVPIPEKLELECSELQFRDVIRLDRVLVPDGVRFSDRTLKIGDEFILGVVFGKGRGMAGDDEEEGEEGAEAGT